MWPSGQCDVWIVNKNVWQITNTTNSSKLALAVKAPQCSRFIIEMWVPGSIPVRCSFEPTGKFASTSRRNATFSYILSLCPFPKNIVGINPTFYFRQHECMAFNSFIFAIRSNCNCAFNCKCNCPPQWPSSGQTLFAIGSIAFGFGQKFKWRPLGMQLKVKHP